MRHIVVSSNCHIGGLAAALSSLLVQDKITALPFKVPANPAEEAEYVAAVRGADVWISIGNEELVERHGLRESRPGFQFLHCPDIVFTAFHPDLCYLTRISTGRAVEPHYNSSIVAWAYRHGLPAARVPALFTRENFHALGYLSRWQHSVAMLRQLFESTGWAGEFDAFMLNIQRRGNFMHSINHPRPEVLVRLGMMLAVRLGADPSVYARDLVVPDAFADDNVWPLYPEIADALGLPTTGYVWRMWGRNRLGSVAEYVDYAYAQYAAHGLRPDDFKVDAWRVPDMEYRLDAVLGPLLEAAA